MDRESMIQDIYDDVKAAASATAQAWPGVIDADDAAQDIWVVLLSSRKYVSQVYAMSAAERRVALRRIGRQSAVREGSSYEVFQGQVFYSAHEVRELLESGVLRTSGEFSAERMDAWLAMDQLAASYQAILIRRYDLKEALGESEQRAAGRAADALTEAMNRVRRNRESCDDGPGTRKVVSNAAAQALTRTTDEGL